MAASYKNSAWFYDSLSRLVYGRALVNAQLYLLNFISANANVLIIGGGTGWILEELTKLHPSGLSITYVEVAEDMMARSKARKTGENKVVFVQKAVESAPLLSTFDIVFTPFLFDNFTDETLRKVFGHVSPALKPDGLWLTSSFQLSGKWWQNVLLKTMFIFFRLVCNIEASKLPDIDIAFQENNYRQVKEKAFFGEFVRSGVYRR